MVFLYDMKLLKHKCVSAFFFSGWLEQVSSWFLSTTDSYSNPCVMSLRRYLRFIQKLVTLVIQNTGFHMEQVFTEACFRADYNYFSKCVC